MLEFWHKNTENSKGLMNWSFMKPIYRLLEKRMILSQQLTEDQTLSRLYKFETIPAELFYRIMAGGNVMELENPLLKPQKKLLNPEAIFQRYLEIQEAYSIKTDKENFEAFLNKRNTEIKLDIEMASIDNAFFLLRRDYPSASETLENFGVKGSFETIENKIKQMHTKYNFQMEKRRNELKKKSDSDYYLMLAKVRKMGFMVQSNISLIEWCGILNEIKLSNVG